MKNIDTLFNNLVNDTQRLCAARTDTARLRTHIWSPEVVTDERNTFRILNDANGDLMGFHLQFVDKPEVLVTTINYIDRPDIKHVRMHIVADYDELVDFVMKDLEKSDPAMNTRATRELYYRQVFSRREPA